MKIKKISSSKKKILTNLKESSFIKMEMIALKKLFSECMII